MYGYDRCGVTYPYDLAAHPVHSLGFVTMVPMLLGTTGSGKSYEAVVYHVMPSIEAGRKVITNLPLNLDKFREVYGDKADLIRLVHPSSGNPIPFKTLNDFGDDWRHEESNIGPLYVIDECHKALPRGGTLLAIEEWFAEHRHEGADVLLITQSYGKVSRSIIDIVHIVYRVRKNIALGSTNSYVRKVQDGVRGEVVNTSIRKYKPEFFAFYKSHTKSNQAVEEENAKDITPIWRHWTFLVGIPLLLFGLFKLFTQPLPFKPEPKVVAPPSPVVNPFANKAIDSNTPEQMQSKAKAEDEVKASHPFYKLQMHIGGYIENATKTRYLYNIILSQNGQVVATITNNDLMQAGYVVQSLGSCLFKVTFKQFFDYVTCDAPRAEVKAKENFTNSAGSPSNAEKI